MKSKSNLIFLFSSITGICIKLMINTLSLSFDAFSGGVTKVLILYIAFLAISLTSVISGFNIIRSIYREQLTLKSLIYAILFFVNLYLAAITIISIAQISVLFSS